MTDTIRIGIVGAGFFGSMIADAAAGHPDFRVVAVADALPAAAATLAQRHHAHVAADHHDLIRRDDVDLVVVATPNHLHAPPAIATLAAGKHVFVEKPLAINGDDLEAILAAESDSAGQLIVGHVMRTLPGVSLMLDQARSGALGTLIEARGVRRRIVHPPVGTADWWKLDARRSGGELLHEIHELDLVVLALGEADTISSTSGAPSVHGDTDTHTAVRFRSGALGTHSLSTSAHAAEWSFRVAGTDAALVADFRAATVVRIVDGRVEETTGVFADDASNQSLRDAANAAQAYNVAGSHGALWMQTAVQGELDEVAAAVKGTSDLLTRAPADAALVALAAQTAPQPVVVAR